MTNAVTLSYATRSTLGVLQTLSRHIGASEQRLSTGLKLTSALDNPPVYFQAKGLNDRANDLAALKDGMAQAISTLKAGATGINNIEKLVEHAKGLTTAALSDLGNDAVSKMVRANLAKQYDEILRQIDKMAGDSGYGGKNLLVGDGRKYDATVKSKAEVNTIPGISGVQVTNVKEPDRYKVLVSGDGAISANGDDKVQAETDRGINNLRIYGYNNKKLSNFDDVTIELTGKDNGDRTITVSDGRESHAQTFTQAQINAAKDNGNSISFEHIYGTGLQVKFDVDLNAISTATFGTSSIKKYVDLNLTVTNHQGISHTRTLGNDQNFEALDPGMNDFVFDSGTVRLNVDPSELQKASTWSTKVVREDGALFDAFTNIVPSANVDRDYHFALSASGSDPNLVPPAYVVTAYNKSANELAGITYSNIVPTISNWDIWNEDGTTIATLTMDRSKLGDSNGMWVIYNDQYGGFQEMTPTIGAGMLGDFTTDEHWSGFNTVCLVNVDIGDVDSGGAGFKTVSISDGLGGTFNGTVNNVTYPKYNTFTLTGGPNNGAKMLLGATTGSPANGSQYLVSPQGYSTIRPAIAGLASYDTDDIEAFRGWKNYTQLNILVGADDSGGSGLRTVTINDVATGGSPISATISNNAENNVLFTMNGGQNHSAILRLDFPANAGGGFSAFEVFPPIEPVGTADFTVRAGNVGKSAEIETTMTASANNLNDLSVQLNEKNTNRITLNAVDVTTASTGLALDRSINGWENREDIEKAVDELVGALTKLRSSAQVIATHTGIVVTRSDFAKEFADVLAEGSNKLSLVDQNEEGATLLALQTRQSLATTGLTLSSRNDRAILDLF